MKKRLERSYGVLPFVLEETAERMGLGRVGTHVVRAAHVSRPERVATLDQVTTIIVSSKEDAARPSRGSGAVSRWRCCGWYMMWWWRTSSGAGRCRRTASHAYLHEGYRGLHSGASLTCVCKAVKHHHQAAFHL